MRIDFANQFERIKTSALPHKKRTFKNRNASYESNRPNTNLPLGGFIANVLNDGVTLMSVIFYGIFGLIAWYMIRVSLWNTYGTEVIHFQKNKFNYAANYQWFKGSLKEFDFENIDFTIQKAGYEEDHKGVLVIKFDEKEMFETVSKFPLSDLEILLINLKALYSDQTLE